MLVCGYGAEGWFAIVPEFTKDNPGIYENKTQVNEGQTLEGQPSCRTGSQRSRTGVKFQDDLRDSYSDCPQNLKSHTFLDLSQKIFTILEN